MTRKYTEVMDNVTLDADVKNRILKNISETNLDQVSPVKERRQMHWKPVALIAGVCAAVLVFIAVPNVSSPVSVASSADNEDTLLVSGTNAYDSAVQSDGSEAAYAASSAYVSCDTLEELEEDTGFSIKEPVFGSTPSSTTYHLYGSQAYIVYDLDGEMVTLTAEDKPISDQEWTYSKEIKADDMDVLLEGYEEDNWQGMKYDINGIYYEMTVSSPIDERTIISMLPVVK